MMKNRKLIILIVLVAGVWGTIAYQIVNQFSDDDITFETMPMHKKSKVIPARDFTLSLSYTDPFLKKQLSSSGELKKNIRRPAKAIIPPPPAIIIDWSVIQYEGLVFNKSRQIKMASVKVNGNDYFVREGDEVEGFLISDIHPDSIKLIFSSAAKYIKKQ